MYDRYLDTYAFNKDEKRITLASLAPHQLCKHKAQKNPEQANLLLTLVQLILRIHNMSSEYLNYGFFILSLEVKQTKPCT